MSVRVGMVGLGRMGAAMAARLIERGHQVSGWNRTASRAAAIQGLTVKASPAETVASADIVIVMLLDEEAARPVYHGDAGLLAADLKDTVILDMSTLKPRDMLANAEAVRAVGGAFVACPVGGTVGPARAGKLLGLAGGEAAAIERALPVLNDLCDRIERFAEPEAASAMKLAINLPLLAAFQALGESILMTRDYGIPADRVVSIIGQSPGGAPAIGLRREAILSEIGGKPASVVGFSLDAVEKDLRLIDEVGGEAGFDLPLALSVRGQVHDAVREGWGERDLAALAAFNLRA
ncbi:MAG: NADPH oxidoreductase [Acidiphilium sp. 37-64-53]|uniref:NAD(P)-dependent oxidoreductase n=1 Tax=Acidiphilium TaxID=522 RepID=UPI000BD5A15D|nr:MULTISPECIES: NAD(P)-dependent oxidoreductase [Acidiphilium]OYW00859.1 MAG: NADPH oxidoreductase [Acidiphilium sp. 37-64-53]OZB27430.1 MAG: NADPH oxidoreductase [Acidiphilium sp. 34-64-41]HQT86335.1 NAD(P)-dependent oxidoreductase [Acidiphilium rubrum]